MSEAIHTPEGRRIPLRLLRKKHEIAEPDASRKLYVVSYPKCGRTWLRVMLSRYKQHLLALPEFHLFLHRIPTREPFSRQVLFTHANADYPHSRRNSLKFQAARWLGLDDAAARRMDFGFCRGAKVVFLVRDPRDAVVSYYHHRAQRLRSFRYRGPISAFIRDPYVGLPRLIAFMNLVARERCRYDHLTMAYEDLRADPAAELERLLRFAGFPVRPEALAEAVDYGSFSNMARLETGGGHSRELQAASGRRRASRKVRRGQVGGYRTELSAADIAWLDEQLAASLDPAFARYLPPAREADAP